MEEDIQSLSTLHFLKFSVNFLIFKMNNSLFNIEFKNDIFIFLDFIKSFPKNSDSQKNAFRNFLDTHKLELKKQKNFNLLISSLSEINFTFDNEPFNLLDKTSIYFVKDS